MKDNSTRHKLAPVRSRRSNWSNPDQGSSTLHWQEGEPVYTYTTESQRAQEPAPPGGLGSAKEDGRPNIDSLDEQWTSDQPSTLPSPSREESKIDFLDKGKRVSLNWRTTRAFCSAFWKVEELSEQPHSAGWDLQSLTLTFSTSYGFLHRPSLSGKKWSSPRLWKAQVLLIYAFRSSNLPFSLILNMNYQALLNLWEKQT